jgi:C4-dicarboxylate transporter DctM subunit
LVRQGIDPTHLGIIMVVNTEVGMVTPPVGLNLYVTSAIAVPRVKHFLTRHKPPFIAKVYRPSAAEIARHGTEPGRVELWYAP